MASTFAAPLTVAILTTAVIVVLSRRRRRRRARRAHHHGVANGSVVRDLLDIGLIGGGIILAIGTLLVGTQLLHVQGPPDLRTRPGAIGVVPPRLPKVNRGFAVALGIRVKNCSSPVYVTLSAGGTAEYWQDRAQSVPATSSILLALRRAKLVSNVAMYQGLVPEDVTGPLDSFTGEHPVPLHAASPVQRLDATVLRATTPHWGTMQYAVLATFQARWLYPRSLGTCYLSLPTLVGGDTVLSAEEALGHASWNANASFPGYDYTNTDNATTLTTPLEPALQTIVGNATVAVDHGDVETSLSQPPPNALFDGNPKWTCENPALQVQPLPKSGSPPLLASGSDPNAIPVFSLAGVQEQGLSDCSGLVVVAEAGSDSRLTLLLLLMGSLISLGAAVAVEVMLDWREFGLPFRRSRIGRPVEHAVEADAATA
jgi:hypothetical protein